MKLLNTELPNLFKENGAPEACVANIKLRLNMIGDQIAKEKGCEVFLLPKEWGDYVSGFLEGTCLMLYSGKFIDEKQYKNITNGWVKYCESLDIN